MRFKFEIKRKNKTRDFFSLSSRLRELKSSRKTESQRNTKRNKESIPEQRGQSHSSYSHGSQLGDIVEVRNRYMVDY